MVTDGSGESESALFQHFDGLTAHHCDACQTVLVDGWISISGTHTYVLCRDCMVALHGLPPSDY